MTAVEENLATGASSPPRSFWRDRGAGWLRQQYPLLILIVLFAVASLSSDAFLTSRNLQNLVLQISVTGIVALAQLLVVVSGGIDISVGSVLGLACVLSAGMFGGSSTLVGLGVALVVGMVLGALNGFMVAFRGLEPFIVTLGMLALARGLVYAYTEGSPLTPSAPSFTAVGTATVAGVPVLGIIWLLVAVGLAFLLRRTVFGRRVFAVGSRVEAAQASGIPVRGTLVSVYVIAGLLVGLGGFLLVSRVGAATPTAGNLFELDAIAAVVIGGARLNGGQGKVVGTVIGTAIFGVISNLLVLLNVSTFLQDAFRGALILLAIGLATIGRNRSRNH
ncbi:ABC transporter permease [Saccharopolyspora oryzae]|uniref:ABC transporter permease n=1 Tax=Saccharopolyspora oryzae TaxID=2997343 RepID=A0ABT4V4W3_9PSEU|nr:ABC transporter permease [Saccharopolyspora oryzae]MDA3628999.1 ABC transporter permease [Saccharopolyspora oryzae]